MEERVQEVRMGSTMGPKCRKSGRPQTILGDLLLLSTSSSTGLTHPLSLNHAVKDTPIFVCGTWGSQGGGCNCWTQHESKDTPVSLSIQGCQGCRLGDKRAAT